MSTFTFTKAVKRQEKLRLALDGTAGSGKTWTALIIANYLAAAEDPAHRSCRPGSSEPCGHIAVIDSERSSARKYASDFAFDHLTLPDFNPHTYIGAVRAAVAAAYPVIDIDSFSHAWEGVLQFKDDVTARSRSKNSYTEGWREATPVHNELVDTVLRADAHIIATLRTKTEYVIDDGKPTKVGMKPIQRDGVDFEFDVVGDMTPENSLIVSKTRCSKLTGQVIRKPDVRLAETLWEWLNDGEEMLGPAEVDAIKDALNAAGQAARRAWLDRFGMRPDDLPAARRDEAMAFLDALPEDTNRGAGVDGPDRGGDAGSAGDRADSHDVGRTGPEPTPHQTGEGEPAAGAPHRVDAGSPEPTIAGRHGAIGPREITSLAERVFKSAGESAPRGQKTAIKQQLRYALTYASTNGQVTSARQLDGAQLHEVYARLGDIADGRMTYEHDAEGATFTLGDHPVRVAWSDLAELTEVAG